MLSLCQRSRKGNVPWKDVGENSSITQLGSRMRADRYTASLLAHVSKNLTAPIFYFCIAKITKYS